MAFKAVVSYRQLKAVVDTSATASVASYVNLRAISQYLYLRTVTDYRNLTASEILIDSYSLNQWFLADVGQYELDGSTRRGLVTLTDSPVLSTSKAFSEAAQLTESVFKGFSSTTAETLSLSDSLSKVLDYGRTFTETATMSESIQSFAVGKAVSDSASILESSVYNFSKALTETPTVTDASSLGIETTKSDSVSTSDSPTLVNVFVRAFSDSAALDDTASASDDLRTDVGINKGNVVTMSDALSHVMAYASTLADTPSLSESAAISFSTTFAETPSLSDSPAISFSTSFADSATISESILVELISGRGARFNTSPFNTFTLNS